MIRWLPKSTNARFTRQCPAPSTSPYGRPGTSPWPNSPRWSIGPSRRSWTGLARLRRQPRDGRDMRRTTAASVENTLEVVDPHHIPAQDQLLLILRHAGEVAGDGLARLREGGVEVRVVGAPHHLVHADQVAAAYAGHIILEGGVHLAAPVVDRVQVELGKAWAKAPGGPFQPLQIVRDPADVVLDRDDLELRVPLKHTARDHFGDGLEGRHRQHDAVDDRIRAHLRPALAGENVDIDREVIGF